MIAGVDSSFGLPTDAALVQAKAAGIRVWAGYLPAPGTNRPEPGFAATWTLPDFMRVRSAGLETFAYVSGNSDPAAIRAEAAQFGVTICLDVENGIRSDGGWVQSWLDQSGAGLYGNQNVHNGRNAAFHILAAYPGYDPRATWGQGRPPGVCGWQWMGTHTEFGLGVDRLWLDDAFLGILGDMDAQQLADLARVSAPNFGGGDAWNRALDDRIKKLEDPNFGGGNAWNAALEARLEKDEAAILAKAPTPAAPVPVAPAAHSHDVPATTTGPSI